MQAKKHHNLLAHYGQPFLPRYTNKIRVRTTRDTYSKPTGTIFPAGTVGILVDYQFHHNIGTMLIDFGVSASVFAVPVDCHLVEILTGCQDES